MAEEKRIKETTVTLDYELWKRFKNAILERLDESNFSRGLAIVMSEWLKKPGRVTSTDAGEEPREAFLLLHRLASEAPEALMEEVLQGLHAWVLQLNDDDEDSTNQTTRKNQPKLSRKGQRLG